MPRPEVAWSRGDKELKKGKRLLFEEEEVEGGVKYKMTVADITQKDFGDVSRVSDNSNDIISYYYPNPRSL